jgi:hypothetical protein
LLWNGEGERRMGVGEGRAAEEEVGPAGSHNGDEKREAWVVGLHPQGCGYGWTSIVARSWALVVSRSWVLVVAKASQTHAPSPTCPCCEGSQRIPLRWSSIVAKASQDHPPSPICPCRGGHQIPTVKGRTNRSSAVEEGRWKGGQREGRGTSLVLQPEERRLARKYIQVVGACGRGRVRWGG